MPLDVEALLVEIADIHSDADVDQEITDKINAAVEEAVADQVPAEVSKDTAALQAQVDSYGAALKAVVDKLTAPGVVPADAIAGAITTAQNAITPAPDAKTDTGASS